MFDRELRKDWLAFGSWLLGGWTKNRWVVLFFLFSLVFAQTLIFTLLRHLNLGLVLFSLAPGLFWAWAVFGLEKVLGLLKFWLLARTEKILLSFLLFFAHVIGYMVVAWLLLYYPMGFFIDQLGETAVSSGDYARFSVNFMLVVAVLSWLNNLRTVSSLKEGDMVGFGD